MAVAATTLIRFIAEPAFAGRGGFVAFILPVALAAWAGGLGPGLLATALALPVGWFAFVSPIGATVPPTVGDATYAVTFAIGGIVVSALASGLRSGRERAERNAFRAERLQALAAALSTNLTAAEAAHAVLREGIHALGAGRGVIAIVDPGGETLTPVSSIGFDTTGWERFEHFRVDADYPLSEAVRLDEPIIIQGTAEMKARYPSLGPDIHAGGPAVVVPLLDETRRLGGLYYRFAETRASTWVDREYLLALGRLCAAALERARLHDLEVSAAARTAFLAQATAVLTTSLDFEATVEQVAALTVPSLADYCTVHLLEADGSIRTLALASVPVHVDAARRLLEVSPPGIDDEAGIGAVIREGEGLLIPHVTDDMLRAGIQDPAVLEATLALEIGSHLSVPLVVGGKTIGALALTNTKTSDRSFNAEDMTLARELASRAASAIENARLFSSLVAREAQQAAVARLGQLALAEQDTRHLFDATMLELTTVLGVTFAQLLEIESDGQRLRLVAGAGWATGIVGGTLVSAGLESQAGYTLVVDEPVVVDDLPSETRFQPPPLLMDHGVISGMTVAVVGAAGPWGVLGVHATRRRAFTLDDTVFLTAVSNVLAGAIERRRRLDGEREAHDINRAFIGVVSHELRTPITTIYGGAKMLGRSALSEADRAELIADVEGDAERLYRLTEDLLVLTRLERHDLEVGKEPVLLTRLAERVIASERKRWPLVKVRLDIASTVPPVEGEDNYVEQVLRNLVGNAAKYSPAGGVVEVTVEQAEDESIVRVLDRGPGILGEDPSRLFSLFYRAPATATQASGAGIGLFVSRQLVLAMGGRLWAKARDGGGSEFGFALLRYADEEASAGGGVRVVTEPQAGAPAPL